MHARITELPPRPLVEMRTKILVMDNVDDLSHICTLSAVSHKGVAHVVLSQMLLEGVLTKLINTSAASVSATHTLVELAKLRNSTLYGKLAQSSSTFYNPSIANVVTYAGRFQLRAMMRACHGSVISADTDGLIVKSSPHAVASIIEEVNAYMQQLITIAHDHVPLDCA